MNCENIEHLLDIALALSCEKNCDKLYKIILQAALSIANCDTGILYRKENNELLYKLAVSKSKNTERSNAYGEINISSFELSRKNVCSCAVLERKIINVKNIKTSEDYDFCNSQIYGNIASDAESMLVVPMEDNFGDIIGVIQLINAGNDNGAITDFNISCEQVIFSLASQAAICLTNIKYDIEIQDMFDSFIRVMSMAIDARTPYNANHTRNIVKYASAFFDWLDETDNEKYFNPILRPQFLMSAWLHDVGKLTIPIQVMDKESRLGPALNNIKQRFRIIKLLYSLDYSKGKISENNYSNVIDELSNAMSLIQEANNAACLSDDIMKMILSLSKKVYTDENSELCMWITTEELEALTVKRGTLTANERNTMESHIYMTRKILSEIPFPKYYDKVVRWASLHHEFLDGSGYPEGLKSDEIDKEVRLLTILDVFDALTALDRPYKKGMSSDEAMLILYDMANNGKLDKKILSLFKHSRAWER